MTFQAPRYITTIITAPRLSQVVTSYTLDYWNLASHVWDTIPDDSGEALVGMRVYIANISVFQHSSNTNNLFV